MDSGCNREFGPHKIGDTQSHPAKILEARGALFIMKRWFFLVLLGGFLVWGTNRLRARTDDGWSVVAPGVEMRTLRASDESGATVVALRTTPNRVHIAADAAATGEQLEAEAWRRRGGALAAVNGGYFDAAYKPLGLRIAKGRKVTPLHGTMWGVFSIRSGKASIVTTEAFKMRRDIQEAVQCGPRLVMNGQVQSLKMQWARRTGIGVMQGGKVIIAVADGEMSLPAWAALWAAPDGLNCRNALNLDGGPSSQLALKTATRHVNLRSGRPVSDAILIY